MATIGRTTQAVTEPSKRWALFILYAGSGVSRPINLTIDTYCAILFFGIYVGTRFVPFTQEGEL